MSLVLARDPGKSIIIDGNIKVTVASVNKFGQVKLAITAPDDVTIDREEIALQKQALKEKLV
jgi:carbon storage regulator CsrA